MGTVTLGLSLLAVALLCPATAMLRIGAFNIQAFGDTKMSNKEVAEIIINVSATRALWGWAVCWDRPQHGSCARDVGMWLRVGWHRSAGDGQGG